MSSLALLAAGAQADGPVAAAVSGGHGELFVQDFDARLDPAGALLNASAATAAAATSAPLVVGSGAQQLVAVRGWGTARDAFPSAADLYTVPVPLRSLEPRPLYARDPDAKAMVA
jgi:tRNA A37 threonylcarbamoyladenosine modification protein TsaB